MDVDPGLQDDILDQPPRSEGETPRADDDPEPFRRKRGMDEQIPPVVDNTGEIVRRAFLAFLET
jgi:hypothetical protein